MECFVIYKDEIEGRLDPFYYRPYFKRQLELLSKTKFEIVKLKDVCEKITDGTHYTPKYVEKGIPFISVKDVRENEINFNNVKFISEEEHEKLIKRCKPEPGDILLTKVGTVGLAAVIPQNIPEFSIFVSVALLKIDKKKTNPYYISAILNSKYTKIQIDRVLKGIGVPDFHLENIAEIKIPLPPIEVQNLIAQIMDNAYNLKKQKESEAKQLLDSINYYVLSELGIEIQEIKDQMTFVAYADDVKGKRIDPYYYQPKFEEVERAIEKGRFEVKELKEIADKLLSGQRPKGGVRQIDKGVPSLGGEHILDDGTIATKDLKFIPVEFHKKQLKSKVRKNDILIVKDGATTGKVGIIPEDYPFDEVNINEHIFLLRVKSEVNPYYIFSVLKSPVGQLQINRGITGGTIMGIIRDTVEKIKIPIPPHDIQDKIAKEVKRRMRRVEQLKKEAKQILERAKQEVENIILNGEANES